MASFQRMSQEPKSKQTQLAQIYKLAVLNHTILSSVASLGTYIQSHHTTSASEAFNTIVNSVIKNLDIAYSLLDKSSDLASNSSNENRKEVALRFTELKNIRAEELKNGAEIDDKAFQLKMQEAQLVIEQLMWLTNLSENILKNVKILISSQP